MNLTDYSFEYVSVIDLRADGGPHRLLYYCSQLDIIYIGRFSRWGSLFSVRGGGGSRKGNCGKRDFCGRRVVASVVARAIIPHKIHNICHYTAVDPQSCGVYGLRNPMGETVVTDDDSGVANLTFFSDYTYTILILHPLAAQIPTKER